MVEEDEGDGSGMWLGVKKVIIEGGKVCHCPLCLSVLRGRNRGRKVSQKEGREIKERGMKEIKK